MPPANIGGVPSSEMPRTAAAAAVVSRLTVPTACASSGASSRRRLETTGLSGLIASSPLFYAPMILLPISSGTRQFIFIDYFMNAGLPPQVIVPSRVIALRLCLYGACTCT